MALNIARSVDCHGEIFILRGSIPGGSLITHGGCFVASLLAGAKEFQGVAKQAVTL